MSKNIFSFLHPKLPSTILLDTSFILNLTYELSGYTSTSKYLDDCSKFTSRLIEERKEMYISDWILNEVLYQVINIKIKEQTDLINKWKKEEVEREKEKTKKREGVEFLTIEKGEKIKERIDKYRINPVDIYKMSPGVLSRIYPLLDNIYKHLKSLTHDRRLEESSFAIREEALKLIKSKNMLPTDAYIIATALVNKQIEAIATCDYRDFKRVHDLIPIYVPDKFLRSKRAKTSTKTTE